MGRKSKQNKKRQKRLEEKFEFGMNDQCRHLLGTNGYDACRGAQYEWRCFGNYKNCPRYKTGDLTLPVANYDDWERAQKR